ncbi:hypothetical protein SAMD00019534_055770 [Acytostelium subglobosum LB1]|uniref:hypothetical protein n=1 Tax=Acytostelium subglobosum LB1 TaxID=1410327 RepID=UPI000644F7B6|nr:hypothetical protein SAMD00019534_055770 [Acytostelium subglobosum LB1]GAM22402.1 hypothetical protein SAMD00019534_055770 [Acytostelium subglobosum LB1]|eukprot:XP_012754522.1 hypothetical protein SAMD00019534_055770 [Acytostelium subglobosum LB1]
MVSETLPPADIKGYIEKTAEFAAKFGESFEKKVKDKEKNNPKFSFLNADDQFHQYYLQRIAAAKEKHAAAAAAATAAAQPPPQAQADTPSKTDAASQQPTTATPPTADALDKSIQSPPPAAAAAAPPPPPPEPEKPKRVVTEPLPLLFVLDIPEEISALDLDTMRLTAQFVALNGESFQQGLASRESKNPQFEFLKPTHHLHEWYRALTDSYAVVVFPPRLIKETLKMPDYQDKNAILDRAINRFEWNQQEQIAKKKADEDAEEERALIASIDWHDFVVVDTIDFADDDLSTLPPPKTFEQLLKFHEEEEAAEKSRENDMEVEMDTEMDMDMEPVKEPKLKVVKDYTKTTKPMAQTKKITQVCPMCKQEIPLDQMEEHMRIELMNKNATKRDAPQVAMSTLAQDDEIARNLQAFANRRTDIFGDEEVEIGKSLRPEEEQAAAGERVVWDGHSGSIPRTQTAALAAHDKLVQERERAAQERERALQDRGRPMHGMLPPPGYQHGMMPNNYVMPGMMPFMQGGAMPPPFMPGMMPPPPMPPSMGNPSEQHAEQPLKKQKVEDLLIPEEEFIQNNPGPIILTIEATQSEGNVQTLSITLQHKDTISTLKEKVKETIGIAPNKQKLKAPGLSILKDQNTIAYYNLKTGTTISLGLKERGGRKK